MQSLNIFRSLEASILNLQVSASLNKGEIQILPGCWADPVEQDRPSCLNRSRSPPISHLTQASHATGAQCCPRPTGSPPVAEPTCRGPMRAHFRRRIYKPSTAVTKSLLPSSIFACCRAPLSPPLNAS
jgi:hypothetical protein